MILLNSIITMLSVIIVIKKIISLLIINLQKPPFGSTYITGIQLLNDKVIGFNFFGILQRSFTFAYSLYVSCLFEQ